jgi:hypothetical protein
MPRFRLVFIDVERRVYLAREGERWRLPEIDADADWLAEAADALRTEVHRRYGLDVVALQQLSARDGVIHALMEIVDGERADAPTGLRRILPDELATAGLSPIDSNAVTRATAAEAAGPPWTAPGWWAETTAWIDRQLAATSRRRTGLVRQRKSAWAGSTVLLVPTDQGAVYFKATSSQPAEAAVLLALAPRHQPRLPIVLAADVARGWCLTRDFEPIQASVDDAVAFAFGDAAAALRAVGALQRIEAAHLDEWRALGCADRGVPWLRSRADRLLLDLPPLMLEAGAIEPALVDTLRGARPRLDDLCARLASLGPPDSIHHEDFRPGNVASTAAGIILFDWADTVIAHPFMSAHRFLDDVPAPPAGAPWDWRFEVTDPRAALRDAYLEPWADGASLAVLREAFELTRLLEPLYQLARYDMALDLEHWARSSPPPEELALATAVFGALAAVSVGWASRADAASRRSR